MISDLKDDYLEVFRMVKTGQRFLKNPDLSGLFREWYVPIEQQQVYVDLAIKDPKFFHKITLDCTGLFKQFMYQKNARKTNQIIAISGPPDTGKSYLGLGIMGITKQIKELITDQNIQTSYVFNPTDLKEKIPEMNDFDYIQSDEWMNVTGENSKVVLEQLENFLASMRFTGKSVNICTPMNIFLTGTTSMLVPFGQGKRYLVIRDAIKYIKRKMKFQIIKNLIQTVYNARLTYTTYLDLLAGNLTLEMIPMEARALWYGVNTTIKNQKPRPYLIGTIYLNISSMKALIEEYEKAKEANYRKLEENAGGVTANTTEKVRKRKAMAKRLFELAHQKYDYPNNHYKPSKVELPNYMEEFEIGTGLSVKDKDKLMTEVVNYAKKFFEEEEQRYDQQVQEYYRQQIEQRDSQDEFTINEEELLQQIILENQATAPKVGRNVHLYKLHQEGFSFLKLVNYEIDGKKVSDGINTESGIRKSVQWIQGKLNIKLGEAYERYLLPIFQAKYQEVEYDGRARHFDFRILTHNDETIFMNVKCYRFLDEASVYYTELKAELKAARNYYQGTQVIPKVRLFMYNRFNKQTYTRDLSPGYITGQGLVIGKKARFILRLNEFDQTS